MGIVATYTLLRLSLAIFLQRNLFIPQCFFPCLFYCCFSYYLEMLSNMWLSFRLLPGLAHGIPVIVMMFTLGYRF